MYRSDLRKYWILTLAGIACALAVAFYALGVVAFWKLSLLALILLSFAFVQKLALSREMHPTNPAMDFRELADTMPQIVFAANSDGTWNYFNARWYEFSGSTADVENENWGPYVHTDDLQRCIDIWTEVMQRPSAFELQFRLKHHKSGVYRWQLSRAQPVFDSSGKVERWLMTCTDVHDQKLLIQNLVQSQDILAKTEEKFRFLADTVPNLVWMAQGDGQITFFNQRWLDYTGCDVEKSYAIGGLIHQDDVKSMLDQWNHSITTKTPFDMEYRLLRQDGEYRWQLARALPYYSDKGEVVNWFGSCTDIQDQKTRSQELYRIKNAEEAARESSRLKSEFLAAMSHEIRTPINGVIGMTGFLLETDLSAEQYQYADAVKRSGDALLTVINDILDFSKIEAGQMDYETIPFGLRNILEDVRSIASVTAGNKGLRLEFEVDPSVPDIITGDPGRLRQILNNLVSNAVKFTESGSVLVSAKLQSHSSDETEEGSKILFQVIDSGIGIPSRARPQLFQPFVQADSSTTRRYGGTGLGLTISKHLVESMKGSIGFESEEGKGSTFWFTAHFGYVDPSVIAKDVLPRTMRLAGAAAGVKRRILVVEDVYLNQFIAIKALESLGYSAHAVGNGLEAVQALSESPYDLVLMDCLMPVMDGYEATAQIRMSETIPNPQIPIVAMTACAMKGDLERCLNAGMNDYLSKPVHADTLEFVLEKWLSMDELLKPSFRMPTENDRQTSK